jgi:eukaryotic-like serine/threonine-protein kinase
MDEIGAERWKRIEAILDEALELTGEARDGWVREACAGDPELQARVEALLAADANPAKLVLDVPLHLYAGPLLEDADTGREAPEVEPVEGRLVGPYRLVREVGRGGMATVYLAERTDGQFEQRVALKLIRRGMDSEPVQRRFLQERQILAGLHHPHIAHLLDGGIGGDAQPYFAMEYIEGLPLARYCDDHRLTTAERLQLFLDVCEAVRYAHQHLVIHRDLKPSNILVTPEGQVKLLDFGIAKLLHPEVAEGDTQTRTGGWFLTLNYAAPEQLRNGRITTATDVYALGVILYELLAGHRPYQLGHLGPGEAERMICEEQPRRPSTLVARTVEIRHRDGTTERLTPDGVAGLRGTQPGKLRRRLAGDLDNIVLRALAKEPEQRYPSAEALAEDLRRHLSGQPVRARQATIGYRARKFARRHWRAVAVAALLLLFLTGGIAGTSWQARAASRQAQLAALEAAKAEQISAFLTSLFENSDPDRTRGEEITARELLDRGAQRITAELSGQPAVQAQMLMLVAEVYRKLALHREALPLVEQALAVRRSLHGAEHPEIAASLHEQGVLLYLSGGYDAAEPPLREALDIRRRLLGSPHEDLAKTLSHVAELLRRRGEFPEAERLQREALDIRLQLFGEEDSSTAEAMNNLAVMLRARGADDEAEALYRRALAIQRHVLGEEHSEVAAAMNNVAVVLLARGAFEEAEQLQRQALAVYRKLFGDEHTATITTLNNLAMLNLNRGDFAEAERGYHEVLALWCRRGECDHPYAVHSLNSLGMVLRERGQAEEAAARFSRVVELRRRHHGPEHPQVAAAAGNLARALDDLEDDTRAERLYREALEVARRAHPSGHLLPVTLAVGLARVLAQHGACGEAETLLSDVVAIPSTSGELGARVAEAKLVLGTCRLAAGRYAESETLLLESYQALRERPRLRAATRESLQRLTALAEARAMPARAAEYRALAQALDGGEGPR